ncbi:MAG: class I SAM-dependent methyltransferase [Alphaproteobacteria bacterium]|nr:class I SAM-dependent methyltransferase [Alphaproteobacteria bacterium]
MADDKLDLKRAYAIRTPQDSVELYRDWAETYDESFAARMDYLAPQVVADVFAERATGANGPVLDVGAGTGLVGAALAGLGDWQVDGLDISQEMLAVAMGKGCYRQVISADLTQKLTLADGAYGGVISAGTFTHGHVGPDALDELLRVARPGAQIVLGVNSEAFTEYGFDRKFDQLAPHLHGFEILERRTYGEKGLAERKSDVALVVVFRKA